MEKVDIGKCIGECVAFQDSALYHSSEYTELLLARKVLLELLNPEGLPKLKMALAVLEENFRAELEQAGRYYFACGVSAAEGQLSSS